MTSKTLGPFFACLAFTAPFCVAREGGRGGGTQLLSLAGKSRRREEKNFEVNRSYKLASYHRWEMLPNKVVVPKGNRKQATYFLGFEAMGSTERGNDYLFQCGLPEVIKVSMKMSIPDHQTQSWRRSSKFACPPLQTKNSKTD